MFFLTSRRLCFITSLPLTQRWALCLVLINGGQAEDFCKRSDEPEGQDAHGSPYSLFLHLPAAKRMKRKKEPQGERASEASPGSHTTCIGLQWEWERNPVVWSLWDFRIDLLQQLVLLNTYKRSEEVYGDQRQLKNQGDDSFEPFSSVNKRPKADKYSCPSCLFRQSPRPSKGKLPSPPYCYPRFQAQTFRGFIYLP